MKRRSFLAMLGLAPVAAAGVVKFTEARADPQGDGTYRLAIGYSPEDGWHSGVGIQTRTGADNAYQSAGLLLDASVSGPSRILLEADRFEMYLIPPGRFCELVPIA